LRKVWGSLKGSWVGKKQPKIPQEDALSVGAQVGSTREGKVASLKMGRVMKVTGRGESELYER